MNGGTSPPCSISKRLIKQKMIYYYCYCWAVNIWRWNRDWFWLNLDGEEVGIEGWNDYEDQYGFVYLKSCKDGNIPILVKCLSIGDALVVDVLNLKENEKEPFHIQIQYVFILYSNIFFFPSSCFSCLNPCIHNYPVLRTMCRMETVAITIGRCTRTWRDSWRVWMLVSSTSWML